jgi:hypothetical protein
MYICMCVHVAKLLTCEQLDKLYSCSVLKAFVRHSAVMCPGFPDE